ncbi:MAG: DNA-directed RNA polymerase subunit beta [Anaerolineae bacterium]|nr:DNA-directed RNA polymerase subunit beta [Anaerolineae bacterium]
MNQKKSYGRISSTLGLPALIEVQLKSYEWFRNEGLLDLFTEISPIESYTGNLRLHFPSRKPESQELQLKYRFGDPPHTQAECLERDLTYAVPLHVEVALENRVTGEIQKSEIFLGDFPLMTENGTFIINGTERVVVSQLIRSPGVYFDLEEDRTTGQRLCMARLIPDRGAWLEFESRKTGYLTLKFNRKRTLPLTIFLRALAAVDDGTGDSVLTEGTDEELLKLFEDVDTSPDVQWILTTFRQEPNWDTHGGRSIAEEALLEFYRRVRPGDLATLDNAQEFLVAQLFDDRRYDLQRVGRYKLNQRLGLNLPLDRRTLTKRDIVAVVQHLIRINNGMEDADDIDHLGNRRVKTVGELIQGKLRVGLLRLERVIKERMSLHSETESISPLALINIRPIVAVLREFFGSSQLSQFMDQTNPLAELTHKRTLSALGPGGLRRERAGFEVRDVHHSHYGRICPIETPEGPNIGLIGRLATYARVNDLGFVETPYRKVIRSVPPEPDKLVGEILRERIVDPTTGEVVAEAGVEVTPELAERIASLGLRGEVPIKPRVTGEIVYLSADKEERYTIAQATTKLDEKGRFLNPRVSARRGGDFLLVPPEQVDLVDVAPSNRGCLSSSESPSWSTTMPTRALMGSNMQRQAVPLLIPEAPLVGTGVEWHAAVDSGQVVVAEADGEVISVTSDRIIVLQEDGTRRVYPLRKYNRSNQSTCVDQRPVVFKGQRVRKGQVLADSSATQGGELALGRNVLCAFISWEGWNFEDAIIISESLVRDDKFTSIHIEKHETEARDTKLGPEEITRDIPNVGEDALRDLDERGIIRIGAEVGPSDILVGKITPKGEKELTPEEKLLRAIFGEKAREVKDSSLRMPHGERGKVIDVKVFDREEYRDLPTGVEKMVRVSVAQRRKITEGDKMAGRHGNKGVVSRVVPIEDMPFLKDGTPVEIILNPLGVPGRMNIGQILETHLGWAVHRLGFRAVSPVFDGANEEQIAAELARAWMMDRAWQEITERAWAWLRAQDYPLDSLRDDDEARLLFILSWLPNLGYDEDRLARDYVYARRAVLREWLRERGYNPDFLLSFEDDTRSLAEREKADRAAHIACLRLWLEDHGEDTSGLSDEQVELRATEVSAQTKDPLPTLGKAILYDGMTGEPFDQPVTVGMIYMMKLAHMVEDKIHARSTGPYSLVTQQPLGGKARFGGQRFGEMEVWALEAYGAAYTLQEMLTIKSDDVQGRVRTYEAIVKGKPITEAGLPASFKVLVKELQSLGLAVEAVTETGEVLRFGREETRPRIPRLAMGLLGLGDRHIGETDS